jgi:hypothetical protein
MEIYLIGSLRNSHLPSIGVELRKNGIEVFDDWYSPGPEADDYWKKYSEERGQTYSEALRGWAAKHVFEFDKHHLDRCDGAVLVLPAGKSCHLELGYIIGTGKPGWIYFPKGGNELRSLPSDWLWLTGVYEGEGSLTRNNAQRNIKSMQLSVTMKDKDIIERLYKIAGVGNIQGPYKRSNPKWSDMWRWSVYKKEDILYVLRGMWGHLGNRRKDQVIKQLTRAGIDLEIWLQGPEPYELRWDVMNRFAFENGGDIAFSFEELVEMIKDG